MPNDELRVRPPAADAGWRIVGRPTGLSGAAVLRLSEDTALAVDPTDPRALLWLVAGDDDLGNALARTWLGAERVARLLGTPPPAAEPARGADDILALGRAALCAAAGGIDDPLRWGFWCAELLGQLARSGLGARIPAAAEYLDAAVDVLGDLRLRVHPARARLLDLVESIARASFLDEGERARLAPCLAVLRTDSGLDSSALGSPPAGRPRARPVVHAPLATLGPRREAAQQLIDGVCWLDVAHRLGLGLDAVVTLTQRAGAGRLTISGVTRHGGADDLYVRVLGVDDDGGCTTLDLARGTVDTARSTFVAGFTIESAARFGFDRVLVDVVPTEVAVTEPDDLATELGRAFAATVTRVAIAGRSAHDVRAALSVAGEALVILGVTDSSDAGTTMAAEIASRIDLSFVSTR